MTKGYLNLYNLKCVKTNKCIYKDEALIELPKYDDINGFISIKKDIGSTDDNYSPLVYCSKDNNSSGFSSELFAFIRFLISLSTLICFIISSISVK